MLRFVLFSVDGVLTFRSDIGEKPVKAGGDGDETLLLNEVSIVQAVTFDDVLQKSERLDVVILDKTGWYDFLSF